MFISPSKNQLLWDIRNFIQYIQENNEKYIKLGNYRVFLRYFRHSIYSI